MEPLMGNEQAKFDVTKFSWVGSMNQDISFCGLWQGPGAAASFDDLMKKDARDAVFGSSGTAAISHQHPLILRNVLGAHIRVIPGYDGQKEVNLAMQRGEMQGACGLFVSSIKTQWLRDVEAGRLKLVIQMGPKTTGEFGAVPSAFDYVKTDEDRKVLEIHFKQTILGRPLAGPPGMPNERLAVLRKALMDTLKDREFLAEAERANLDVDPATAEQVEHLLKQFADYPKAVVEKAKAAIGR
jgi:tripartite-type tricarboxylate transporter receptor subunit TctC